jgi:hypothetical protein
MLAMSTEEICITATRYYYTDYKRRR